MENFFGVDEDPSESLMGDAPSMVAIMKAHKAKQEKEEKVQALSIPKEEEEEELLDTASTTSSVASSARPRLCLRLNPSIQKSIHTQTNVQSPLLNRIYIKPEYLPNTLAIMKELALTKVFIHATMEIVIMEHKPAQWSALISIGYTSKFLLGVDFA